MAGSRMSGLRVVARSVLGVVVAATLIVGGGATALADPVEGDDGGGDPAPQVPAVVSGTVSLQSGEPADGVEVRAVLPGSDETVAETAVVGDAFSLDLEAGTYVLWYVPPTSPVLNALDVFTGGTRTLSSAQPVVVEEGGTHTLEHVVMPLAHVIAGDAVIGGDAVVGSTLTASMAGWAPETTTYSYRWLRNDVPITGATGSSYALTAADAQKRIQVEVTGLSEPLAAATVVSEEVTVGLGQLVPGEAWIEGGGRLGDVLTVATADWPAGSTLSYQWLRDGQQISGARSSTYRITSQDTDASISVVVTARATGYNSASVTSDSVDAMVLRTPTPAVKGTPRVGTKLTVSPGSWTPGTTLRYQWYVNGSAVSGATGATFVPRSSDLGKTITVRVTGSQSGYASASVTSAKTAKVARGTFATAPKPSISGTVVVGHTLRVTAGSWSPSATLRYQWRVNGSAVAGATGSTYTVRSGDRGKTITVTVTASRTGYTTTTRTSAATAKVKARFSRTTTPSISGTARVGSTLTARTTSWSPTASFRYQWYSNGNAISGATGRTLKLTSSLYATKITVKITGSRSGYVTTSRTSSSTSKVAEPRPSLSSNGVFRVGADIAPGTYVATGGEMCYWARRSSPTSPNGIIANDIQPEAGARIVTIRSSDKYFETNRCGSWTRLMPVGPQSSKFSDGTFIAGNQIRPGTYATSGAEGCYWALLSSFGARGTQGVIENQFTWDKQRQIVTIGAGVGFESWGCGTWRRVD